MQEEAVTSDGCHLLIVAGPGTGKTMVLVSRILFLLKRGEKPENILAVTFTNKAASEIRRRLSRAGAGRLPRIGTFHSWAYGLVSEKTGTRPYVLCEREQMDLLREARQGAGIKAGAKDIFQRLSLLKQRVDVRLVDQDQDLLAFSEEYHRLLKKYGVWDYDDLLLKALKIIESGDYACLKHVLVDEFQDVNPVQYRLVELTGRRARVTAIGDPNQSIYGFRGASPSYMERCKEDLRPVSIIKLNVAYRCPQKVLDTAASLMGVKRPLVSARPQSGHIRFGLFENEQREANWIATEIDRMAGGLSFESFNMRNQASFGERSLSDICILYRAKVLSAPIEAALSRRGIPFHVPVRLSGTEQKAITLFRHLFEFSTGRAMDYHLSRLGIKTEEARRLSSFLEGVAQKRHSEDKFLESFRQVFHVEMTEEEASMIRKHIRISENDVPASLIFKEEQDGVDFSVEAVTLMTLHASKGLEFPVVFLAGVDREIMPWKETDKEEERRLLFVGMTRSSDRLFITSSRNRRLYGKRVRTGPSPFLKGIEAFFSPVKLGTGRPAKKSIRRKQKNLF